MKQRSKLFLIFCIPLFWSSCNSDSDIEPSEGMEEYLNRTRTVYITFDDQDGSDSSGNNHHAIPIGDPSFITDTPSGNGYAIRLNGLKEQYLNLPYPLFQNNHDFSVSFWIKDFSTGGLISGIAPGSDIAYQRPVFYAANDNQFEVSICTNTSRTFQFNYLSIQSSEWHLITWICKAQKVWIDSGAYYSDGGVMSLYIDGRFVDTITEGYFSINSRVVKVQVGGNGEGAFPVFPTAKLDNVAIYSTALDAKAIGYIYDNHL